MAAARNRDEMSDAVEISQLIRVEQLALATTIGFQNDINQPLQLLEVFAGGPRPSLVLVQFMKNEGCQRVLAVFWHLREALNHLLQRFSHAPIIAAKWGQPQEEIQSTRPPGVVLLWDRAAE